MPATVLFVYGTLRHDQPEHGRFCRGVIGWEPARTRGRLFRIVEGYRLAVVPPGSVLLEATPDAAADEARRARLEPRLGCAPEEGWIEGELLHFRAAARAWPPLDAWEGTVPGRPGLYARCVLPAWRLAAVGGAAEPVAAWAYAATLPPSGAVEVG